MTIREYLNKLPHYALVDIICSLCNKFPFLIGRPFLEAMKKELHKSTNH